jgi:ubiquinone/menaquinone biosynthesis C-methylase UbiE
MKNRKQHYKHQLQYFGHEFSEMDTYQLEAWQEQYISRIKKYVIGNDKRLKDKVLVDIATGSGYVAIEMAKLGLQVIATDLTPEALTNIKKFKKQLKLPNIKLIECYAEKLPLKNESVDYVVANAILEHIPDEQKAIDEWKRILKKNGRMHVTVPLRFRYVWPFLWPINYLHDKRIGHLRRYDHILLRDRFKMPLIKYFYTGHLVKVLGIVVHKLTASHTFDPFFEKIDAMMTSRRYGANNVSVVLENGMYES